MPEAFPDRSCFLAAKSGAERLEIAFALYRTAREMIRSHLEAEHPTWDTERIEREVSRRLSHGAV